MPGSTALQVSGVCHSEADNPKARRGSYDALTGAQMLEGSWPRGLKADCAGPSVITKCGHLGWKAPQGEHYSSLSDSLQHSLRVLTDIAKVGPLNSQSLCPHLQNSNRHSYYLQKM